VKAYALGSQIAFFINDIAFYNNEEWQVPWQLCVPIRSTTTYLSKYKSFSYLETKVVYDDEAKCTILSTDSRNVF
jgi:hypothetical protein